MRWLALLAVVVMLLAGCTAPKEDSASTPTPTAAASSTTSSSPPVVTSTTTTTTAASSSSSTTKPPTTTTSSTTTTTSSSSSSAPPSVMLEIVTILYDPAGDDVPDGGGEYVEIHNPSTTSATMTGWRLSDLIPTTYTFPTFTLGAGATVRVYTSDGTNTATELFWGRNAAVWNNDHDTATLKNASGTVIDTYSY